jgi:hypothetical protein
MYRTKKSAGISLPKSDGRVFDVRWPPLREALGFPAFFEVYEIYTFLNRSFYVLTEFLALVVVLSFHQ